MDEGGFVAVAGVHVTIHRVVTSVQFSANEPTWKKNVPPVREMFPGSSCTLDNSEISGRRVYFLTSFLTAL